MMPGFVSLLTPVQLTTEELPSSFTKTLLFFSLPPHVGHISWQLLHEMQNWVKNGQIVSWEANWGDLGQLERGRWDIWCWKAGGATTLKQSESFIYLSVLAVVALNSGQRTRTTMWTRLQINVLQSMGFGWFFMFSFFLSPRICIYLERRRQVWLIFDAASRICIF